MKTFAFGTHWDLNEKLPKSIQNNFFVEKYLK